MLKNKKGLVFILMAMVISSCSYNSVFDEFSTLDQGHWHFQDTLHFQLEVTDTLQKCDFSLVIRHDNDYHYSNFISFVRLEFPNGRARLDTIEITLAAKNGKWLGQGLGDIFSHEKRYIHSMRFPMKGNYKFTVLHAMRDELLEGMNDVGISIRKAKSN